MNRNQKIVLFITAGVLLVMLVFPPFSLERKQGALNLGYHFVLEQPHGGWGSVDTEQLLVQIVFVSLIGGVVSYALSRKDEEAELDRLS